MNVYSHNYKIINKNNLILSLSVSFILHVIVLFYSAMSSVSILANYYNLGFLFFSLNNILLTTLYLIPIVATIKGEMFWHDAFSIFSIFFIFIVGLTYWGYVFDSDYIIYRFGALSPNSPDLSNASLCYWLGYSEFLFSVFIFILLLTNNKVIKPSIGYSINNKDKLNIIVLGAILSILGIYGFYMSWRSIGIFNLLYNIGNVDLKIPELGYAKYRIMTDFAVLFFPVFGVILLKYLPSKIKLKKSLSIILVFAPIIPILIYGDRGSIVKIVLLSLLVINSYLFPITKKYFLLIFSIFFVFIYLITILRTNPFLKDQSKETLTMVVTGKISLGEYRQGNISRYLYDLDRVVTLACLLENYSRNNELIYGKSLIAAPARFIQDVLERTHIISRNESKWWQGSDYSKYWLYGTVSPYRAGHPPSLPAEFFFQFGFLSLVLLSYAYGKIIFYIRKMFSKGISPILFFFLSIIIVNQLVIIGADVTYVIQILLNQILPIFILFKIIELITNKYYKRSLNPI